MKKILILTVLTSFFSCSSERSTLKVPAHQSIELDYPNYEKYQVKLKNSGFSGLEIAVANKLSGQKIKGFGLGLSAKVLLQVEKENLLIITNNGSNTASIKISSIEIPSTGPSRDENQYISFTLRNTSSKSLPLIIPEVMNPNLSPFSNSGVRLKVGQEILFKEGFKTYVLLKVDDSIKEGEILDIPELLRMRKLELGL